LNFLISIAIILAMALPATTQPTGTIISTGDGDTLRATINGNPTTIRLGCIDAPEKKQRYGATSAARLAELLPRGTAIELRVMETDRYGRTVAEVYRDGRSINLQLVQEGAAVVYREYLRKCDRAAFLSAETTAKISHSGLWGQSPICLPKDFRKKKCQ
jgi:micrococcal nuclease